MNINSIQHLNDKKKKLALFFTWAIFFVVFTIEASFLGYKYYDYNKQEFQKLNWLMQWIQNDYSRNQFFMNFFIRGGWQMRKQLNELMPHEWPRRINNNDVVVYKTSSQEVVFSSVNDSELLSKVIVAWNTTNKWKIININWAEYYTLNNSLDSENSVILFLESKITKNSILKELLQYVVFITFLSFLVYFLGYRFIGYILKPVEENIKDMEQFVHNAWHELKTPLSVIKSSLQLAKLKKDYSESIDDSIKELNKMNLLIESLISLSVLDLNWEKTNINVSDSINSIISEYKEKIEKKNIKVKIIENEKLEIHSNPEYFKIVFSNILSNAIKYNKDWWEIEIIINKWNISVKDTWIGIKKENLEKVYDRFFQDEEARNWDWFWIWLSLVKKIIDLYKWEISIESEKDKGTIVKIEF